MTPLAATPLLVTTGLGKSFGGFTALAGIDLEIRAGERLGLIGPNGSGKSTFVNCLAGDYPDHAGTVVLDGVPLRGMAPHRRAALGLARTFQLPRPFASMTVLENVTLPLLYAPGRPDPARAMGCLEMVGLAARAQDLPRALTQVDLRRLELARAIVTRPRLLLADETMAGLSPGEVDEMLALLLRLGAEGMAIVMIEHIMRAVTAFAERLLVFLAGRPIAAGAPREVLARAEVVEAYLGR